MLSYFNSQVQLYFSEFSFIMTRHEMDYFVSQVSAAAVLPSESADVGGVKLPKIIGGKSINAGN